MPKRSPLNRFLPLLAALSAMPSAQALVSMNDGHDKIFVTGTAEAGWDSNIFANSKGSGDFLVQTGVTAEYIRRAGIIGVDVSAGVTTGMYADHSEENYQNPSIKAEFTKATGRTTGSLQVHATRENKADTSANERNRSFNWGSAFDLHYPVIERYSLTGGVSWERQDFSDNTRSVDIDTFLVKSDLYYAYTSKHDLFAGYRFRTDETTGYSKYNDHDFSVGIKGRILSKLSGTVRLGVQDRVALGSRDGDYWSWSGLAATTWTVNKRLGLTGSLTKDFKTTSTDDATDVLGASLRASQIIDTKWTVSAGIGGGHAKYINQEAHGRRDTYFSYDAAVHYTLNEHFKASLSYEYLKNWSSLSYADYDRHSVTLRLSSRW